MDRLKEIDKRTVIKGMNIDESTHMREDVCIGRETDAETLSLTASLTLVNHYLDSFITDLAQPSHTQASSSVVSSSLPEFKRGFGVHNTIISKTHLNGLVI